MQRYNLLVRFANHLRILTKINIFSYKLKVFRFFDFAQNDNYFTLKAKMQWLW